MAKKVLRQTCPFRAELAGEARAQEQDEWVELGPDRVCSFCLSMHPDEFLSWCERGLEYDSHVKIEPAPGHANEGSARNDLKILIHRIGINSRHDGALHFYTKHMDHIDEDKIQESWQLVRQAINFTARRRTKSPAETETAS